MVKGASGQLLREHTQNCFLVCPFRASASATCCYATSPAESRSREVGQRARMECSQKQRHVPDAKQVLLWRGWVLKQMLNMMFNHASGQLLPEHTWNPRCAQNFPWIYVQENIRASAARAHPKSPPLESASAHKAQRDVHATRLLRSHATSTLGSLSMRKKTCSCDNTAALFMRQYCCICTL